MCHPAQQDTHTHTHQNPRITHLHCTRHYCIKHPHGIFSDSAVPSSPPPPACVYACVGGRLIFHLTPPAAKNEDVMGKVSVFVRSVSSGTGTGVRASALAHRSYVFH